MVKRVTIKKANPKGNHYVISIGGQGMTMAHSKAEANQKAEAFRKQLRKKR